MKKALALFLALVMTLALAACGGSGGGTDKDADKDFVWTREGYFSNEDEELLTVLKSDMEKYPGWYVGVMLSSGEIHGWYILQEGRTLHGNIVPEYEEGEYIVTVSEEGEDGLLLSVKDGKEYHFTPYDVPEATIFVSIKTEGMGGIDYAAGEESPVFDPDYPYQSAQINLAAPETYTFLATDYVDGWKFVKWTKDGEDLSTEPCITLELDESAEYVAVFEAEN